MTFFRNFFWSYYNIRNVSALYYLISFYFKTRENCYC